MSEIELIGSLGCGSAIVELALEITGVPYRLTDLPYLETGPGRDRLLALNPLGQVPTLVLADGGVMTESAAMVLYIGDLKPESGLVPPAGDRSRADFLNLLVRLVSAVYPTFTFADEPEKWTLPGEPAARMKASIDQRRCDIFRQIEAGLEPRPFVFGARPTAVDLYLCVMSRWRPGRAWFEQHCPKIVAVADAVEATPEGGKVMRRNFPAR